MHDAEQMKAVHSTDRKSIFRVVTFMFSVEESHKIRLTS